MKNQRSWKSTLPEALEPRIAPAVIFAVETGTNKLVSFDSASPSVLKTDTSISGLPMNEIITAIDFRPATGELYALGVADDAGGKSGRIYKLNVTTGAATLVGGIGATLSNTTLWGFDFNPVADVIRLTSSLDQNLRVNPNTGALVATDTTLDAAMTNEIINAVAYDRNFGSNVTTLYGYDFNSDNLVRIGGIDGSTSPNGGVVTNIAHAKLNGSDFSAGSAIGFDIAGGITGADTGYLVMRQLGTTITKLYTIDLGTAALTDLGTIGNGSRQFEGMSVQTDGIAPTIQAGGKTATWRDLDGDIVTLKITKGTLTPANFRMLDGGGQNTTALSKLTLTGPQFSGTDIIITAKRSEIGGNGRVNVGLIDATGLDLGTVTVSGDLIAIDAGTDAVQAPSLKSLTVSSMGAFGLGPVSGSESTNSTLEDGAGKIAIAGNYHGFFNLGNRLTGSITIGGDLIGGTAAGRGGFANLTGDSLLGKLTIKGSLYGGDGNGSGQFLLQGVGAVFIGGDIIGGGSNSSGYLGIEGTGKTSIVLGGSLIGGTGIGSASLDLKKIGSLKIGGSVVGVAESSARISITGTPTIAIKGNIINDGPNSAVLNTNSDSTVIKSLTVGGSIVSTGESLTLQAPRFGKIAVRGSILGLNGGSVSIVGYGLTTPANIAESVAIGSLTVGGDVKNTTIAAGAFGKGNGFTSDAAIGAVKIGGNLTASSITAGIAAINGIFGDGDDTYVGGNSGNTAIVAKIASITIGGQIVGTAGGAPDRFGILAEQIGSLTVNKVKIPLTTAKDDFLTGLTGDVRVREL